MNRYLIVLAAGRGTRMKSLDESHPKISFPILGKPILGYVLDTIDSFEFDEKIVVSGFAKELTEEIVADRAKVVVQEGYETASAVLAAEEYLKDKDGSTLIMYGDIPLLTEQTIKYIFKKHDKDNNSLTFLTSVVENPEGYARIIREHKTNIIKAVVEDKDCTDDQKYICEINAGVYLFDNKLLFSSLKEVMKSNKECSLGDLVAYLVKQNKKVETFVLVDAKEMYSVSDRFQLAYAAKVIRKRVNRKLMLSGVSMEDPDTTYISPDVVVGQDTVILPNTSILGNSVIGNGNVIGPNTSLTDVTIGDFNTINSSWISEAKIGNNNKIGPFAKIYLDSEIGNESVVGNFVEIKNSKLSDGIHAHHLAYLGDSDIGQKTNIGCMSVTANFDGVKKHHTIIGNNVFIGTGTVLIAPVKIGDNSFVAAGSVITKDVSEDDLAISRSEQVNKKNGSSKLKAKKAK